MPLLTVEGYEPVEVPVGTTLLEACEDAGIPMECACGGFAACNSCRVQVLSGTAALSAEVEEEAPFLDAEDQRLGCQAEVLGDVHLRLAPGM